MLTGMITTGLNGALIGIGKTSSVVRVVDSILQTFIARKSF